MTHVTNYACYVSQGIMKILFKRDIEDFDIVLFQIYWSTCTPKTMELGLTVIAKIVVVYASMLT